MANTQYLRTPPETQWQAEVHVTQVYCGNRECPVREIEIRTKDYDGPIPSKWCCPACGKPAKLHWQRTHEEDMRITLGFAIGRVNAHLYAREHDDGGGLIAYPASALMLDELPESWKYVDPVCSSPK